MLIITNIRELIILVLVWTQYGWMAALLAFAGLFALQVLDFHLKSWRDRHVR